MNSLTRRTIRPIHPFPARMAPNLAIDAMTSLSQNDVVLDPMVGSGTVLRHAADLGLNGVGFDMDPLAVLMTRVWTTAVDTDQVLSSAAQVVQMAGAVDDQEVQLPWIDLDRETTEFVEFWFGLKQRSTLRRIAYVLQQLQISSSLAPAVIDVLQLALSRIIVTKESGASLARDVSHSRPHRVKKESDYDVVSGFERSVRRLCHLVSGQRPSLGRISVALGDARNLSSVPDRSIDAVVTSPPYLNAIDYMRGHRLALVWLGFRVSDLRQIRGSCIGAERSLKLAELGQLSYIRSAMGQLDSLSTRSSGIVTRYVSDIYLLMEEISRVLIPEGRAILVVGNASKGDVLIDNAAGFIKGGELAGLQTISRVERTLPDSRRYLPISDATGSNLTKRLKTESVITLMPRT